MSDARVSITFITPGGPGEWQKYDALWAVPPRAGDFVVLQLPPAYKAVAYEVIRVTWDSSSGESCVVSIRESEEDG